MNLFLIYAFLFYIGSSAGWVLELLFRKFFSGTNPEHKWINPGFCTGPYLPLYGCGLCLMYTIANLCAKLTLPVRWEQDVLVIVVATICMTVLEYVTGLLCLKVAKVRLWDYTHCWGNIQGIICPLFSVFWGILGAGYYFAIHPYILELLQWLSRNLAFSFVIGMFFGIFVIDASYSFHLIARLKSYADEYQIVVRYENLKRGVSAFRKDHALRPHFLFAFHSDSPLLETLRESFEQEKAEFEEQRQRHEAMRQLRAAKRRAS